MTATPSRSDLKQDRTTRKNAAPRPLPERRITPVFRAAGTILAAALSFFSPMSAGEPLATTLAGGGASTADGVRALSARIANPIDVVQDAAGNLYFSDFATHRVRRMSSARTVTTVAGNGDTVFIGNNGPATQASLNGPAGLALDAAGNLYIAEFDGHRVRRVDAQTGFITVVAGTGVAGATGDGGFATAARLDSPSGLAVDGAGNLYVSDSINHRVRRVDALTQVITTVAGDGQQGDTGDGGPATAARLNVPGGLAFDADGNLYIADALNHRIRKITAGTIATVAGNGTPAFAGDGAAATAASLDHPVDVAVDASGNLYIADSHNHRVRVVRAADGFIATVAGNGTAALSGDGGIATAASLSGPQAVAVDAAGNLRIADRGNARIRWVGENPAISNPWGDWDRDGIPNGIEALEGRCPVAMDNDLFSSARLFARQQYRDFLAREGDAGGIDYWVQQMDGIQSRAQAIQGFFASPEFQGVIAPVARLYFAYFLRYPDYVGLQYHVNRSRTGTALGAISDEFAASPEFQARYGALTDGEFVDLVYHNVLGRPAEPGGRAYWIARIAGGETRGQVMSGFSESPEFVAGIGNEVFVTMMYSGMLRRAPDSGGFAYWVALMDGGQSGLQLTQGFLDAPEYRARFLP